MPRKTRFLKLSVYPPSRRKNRQKTSKKRVFHTPAAENDSQKIDQKIVIFRVFFVIFDKISGFQRGALYKNFRKKRRFFVTFSKKIFKNRKNRRFFSEKLAPREKPYTKIFSKNAILKFLFSKNGLPERKPIQK